MGEKIEERYPFMSHGEDCFISRVAVIDHRAPIQLGNRVTICDRVKMLTHDYSPVMHGGKEKVAGIDIGDRVFIGIDAIILPGVKIGSDVTVGAGAVVSKDLPSGAIYAGNPAQEIKKITYNTL
jgi:maltose O-acetyltransferase